MVDVTTPKPATRAVVAGRCAACGGTGWVRYAVEYGHPDFGKARSCGACHGADRALLARIWLVSGLVPDDPAAPRLAGFQTSHDPAAARVLQAAKQFVASPRGWLTIHGQGGGRADRGDGRWGSGKSHIAEAIARAVLARDIPALYINAPQLVAYLGATWRNSADEDIDYDRRLRWIVALPVLVVDQFNTESSSEAAERLRFAVLDARYQAATRGQGGATVLISNDRPAGWMDPAIASRALDSRFEQVVAPRVDFRLVER